MPRTFPNKPAAAAALVRTGARRIVRRWRYKRLQARMAGPKLLRAFAEAYPAPVFVEIGANDGKQHDHLRPFIIAGKWSGVMVEPVPYVFARLAENYAGLENIRLENAAIADRDGELPFYHLAEVSPAERAGLPEWYDTLGSFSRETVLSHTQSVPRIEERIVETVVPTLTFATLLRKHGLPRVDLVAIDTEGYDAEIVRSIRHADETPHVLLYEHFHLDPGTQADCLRMLASSGYRTFEEGLDTFCLHRDAEPSLQRLWDRLEPAVPAVRKADE